MAGVAILGHGIVGSGVAELLNKNIQSISSRAGEQVEIKYILDIRTFEGLSYSSLFTNNFEKIINDPDVDIIVEAMGGLNPAYEYVSRALKAKKSVVTSNKELVASRGAELLAAAVENNVKFLFEASVGGGIPIIHPIHQCLAANKLDGIVGILNGTTNYILTKMVRENADFGETLKKAQELGYAESNPAADIEGIDTCRKICILASLAFGKHIYPKYVHTQGITGISPSDIKAAESTGAVIKLLGVSKLMDDNKVYIIVAPFAVSRENVLANVEDVFNGILVTGDAIGEVTFFGRGAGKLPTASAVIADIIDCVKHPTDRNNIIWDDTNEDITVDYKTVKTRRLVRIDKNDEYLLISKAVERELHCDNAKEYWFITSPITEYEYTNIFGQIRVLSMIRVLD